MDSTSASLKTIAQGVINSLFAKRFIRCAPAVREVVEEEERYRFAIHLDDSQVSLIKVALEPDGRSRKCIVATSLRKPKGGQCELCLYQFAKLPLGILSSRVNHAVCVNHYIATLRKVNQLCCEAIRGVVSPARRFTLTLRMRLNATNMSLTTETNQVTIKKGVARTLGGAH